MLLDKNSPLPLYHQLKSILLKGIEGGDWKADDRLPTENELALRYGVSKITVRQALRELSNEGYIRREQGRGTFVLKTALQQGPRELTSFTEEMRRHGHTSSSRVLLQRVVEAEDDVAEKLSIPSGDPVLCLRRLRLADEQPMGVQTAYVPAGIAPGLAEADFTNASLYALLETYGLHPAYATETHFAVAVDASEAGFLGVPTGSPAMAAERITFLSNRTPLEFVRSVMRGDRYKIALELTHANPKS